MLRHELTGRVALVAGGFFTSYLPPIKGEESVPEDSLGEDYREFERTRKRLIPGI
jgi:hypothetical protein